MKSVVPALAAVLALSVPQAAGAQSADQWRTAMQSVRWTGPMLASNAETLPQGHFYTEPYFYDVMSGGKHYPGSSGFYQYGLRDDLTVGFQPSFAFGTESPNRELAIGDFKLLSQLRLTHFTPQHRVPTVALVLNATLPTGKHDRLGALKQGHGAGAFAPEVGINVQQYFLLGNGHLLRGRINLLKSFPLHAEVADRSVYGTGPGFRGHARPGSKTTLIGAVEYSVTREWVLAFDIIGEATKSGWVEGRIGSGPSSKQVIAASRSIGFAPAIEYNWSDRAGALFGLWVSPKGHNAASSITPAIAIQRFW